MQYLDTHLFDSREREHELVKTYLRWVGSEKYQYPYWDAIELLERRPGRISLWGKCTLDTWEFHTSQIPDDALRNCYRQARANGRFDKCLGGGQRLDRMRESMEHFPMSEMERNVAKIERWLGEIQIHGGSQHWVAPFIFLSGWLEPRLAGE